MNINKTGFTLIEILLGMIISTSMFILISSITISFINTRTRLNQTSELQTQANNILRTMREDIRWAYEYQDITYTTNTLTITTSVSPLRTTVYTLSEGLLSRKEGTGPDTPIISSEYKITNLTFTVTNSLDRLSLVDVNFTIENIMIPGMKLTPSFTFTTLRTRYGPPQI